MLTLYLYPHKKSATFKLQLPSLPSLQRDPNLSQLIKLAKQDYMEVKSTDKKTLQLIDQEQRLGELAYESLFFLKAQIKLANGEVYELNPTGFFGTSITVTKSGNEIANLKMNWRGQIVIAFQDGQEYLLKAKGIFQDKYILENKEAEKLIQFDPKFNWSKFDYNYDITYDKIPQDILLILLGVYASNYFIAMMSGSTTGM